MKNIIITGGAGFIGSHVVREFVKNNPGRKDEFDTGRTQIKSFEYENQNTTCRDLLALVDTLTVDVQNYNNQNKDDPISTSTIPEVSFSIFISFEDIISSSSRLSPVITTCTGAVVIPVSKSSTFSTEIVISLIDESLSR